jgi:CheY-like chemotaxis protein
MRSVVAGLIGAAKRHRDDLRARAEQATYDMKAQAENVVGLLERRIVEVAEPVRTGLGRVRPVEVGELSRTATELLGNLQRRRGAAHARADEAVRELMAETGRLVALLERRMVEATEPMRTRLERVRRVEVEELLRGAAGLLENAARHREEVHRRGERAVRDLMTQTGRLVGLLEHRIGEATEPMRTQVERVGGVDVYRAAAELVHEARRHSNTVQRRAQQGVRGAQQGTVRLLSTLGDHVAKTIDPLRGYLRGASREQVQRVAVGVAVSPAPGVLGSRAAAIPTEPAVEERPGGPWSIRTLIVEEDTLRERFLECMLRRRGHEITACNDVESAWEEYQQGGPYQLIAVAQRSTDSSGLRLCRRIRELPQGQYSLIVVVGACKRPEDVQASLAAGADAYVAISSDIGLLNTELAIVERKVHAAIVRRQAEEALHKMWGELSERTERLSEITAALQRESVGRMLSQARLQQARATVRIGAEDRRAGAGARANARDAGPAGGGARGPPAHHHRSAQTGQRSTRARDHRARAF